MNNIQYNVNYIAIYIPGLGSGLGPGDYYYYLINCFQLEIYLSGNMLFYNIEDHLATIIIIIN